MDFIKKDENYHFKESETKPNIEKILKSLIDDRILEYSFNLGDWKSYSGNIIQQLRKHNSELIEDKYLNKPIEFIFQLKNKLGEQINTLSFDLIIDNLINNGINDSKKIKQLLRYNSLNELLRKKVIDSIYKSIHLSDANIEIIINHDFLNLYKDIYELNRKIERLNEFFNMDFKEYERFSKNRFENFGKLSNSKKVIDKLDLIQNILSDTNVNDENRNGIMHSERFIYEIYRILDIKNRNPRNLQKVNIKDEFNKIILNINNGLDIINEESLQKALDDISGNIEIKFTLATSEFIPSFISRIDIIEEGEKKKTFIEKFEYKMKIKDRLSLIYLGISLLIFLIIILVNFNLYLDNIGNNRTIQQFIIEFLGHNIYLFSLEILLLVFAFYFLGLFKTYSKIVELYDSHILLIESDFYYKDDKDLNSLGNNTFELRKENTQKIHSLPDKTFEMLNGKNEIKTELPTSKVLDKIGEILEKIVSSIKK